MLASPSPPAPPSPSSSSVSVRKKMPSVPKQKPLPPKSSSCKSSSPMAAQDEIEIEIAEVLYGMMRQPLGPSKLETGVNDSGEAGNVNPGTKSTVDVKSRVSSLISNSQSTLPLSVALATNSIASTVSAIAPKRKRPRPVTFEDENSSALPSRMSSISSTIIAESAAPAKAEAPSSNIGKISGSIGENDSVLDSTNPSSLSAHPQLKADRESRPSLDSRPATAEELVKKESSLSKEESISTKIEGSSGLRSDGDGVVTIAAKTSLPPLEKEKFEIDLMAPPPARSSPERDGEMEYVAAEAKPKAVETDAKPLLHRENGSKAEKFGSKEDSIREPDEKKPRTAMESESQKSDRNTELKLDHEKSDRETTSSSATVGLNKLSHLGQKQHTQQHMPSAERTAQASPLPVHMSMPGWPGGLPTMGYMAPTQGVVPADTSSLPSATMQPPQLLFNQPRPKRCATHCYIARNIHYHQQFTKMNPFWPSAAAAAAAAAAGSAPLYGGGKACNLSLMPSTELQGNVLGRSSNLAPPDKSSQSTTSNSSDTSQRKQILLQPSLPPGAPNNILHGPAFIFPLGQQPHAAAIAAASVRPPMSGNAASSGTASSTPVNGSAPSATPAGATAMSFSYPNMPGNETQYLAILQNNGYPFPVPAHVGPPPAYRGPPGQPIPFFNGSFYSSQMIHPPHLQPQQQPGQGQQGQAPNNNQTASVSSGSSSAQKHLQNQQQRAAMNPGNPQRFPASKVQSQPMSFQQRQHPRENATQQNETAGEDSPSTADSRISRSSVAYGQNFAMPMQPTNLGLMNSAASGGAVAGSSGNHGEKKSQQQGSKAGVDSLQSQAYAMTFATFNGASSPGLNMPSIAQNHAIFHSIPEAARQGYHQMMAAAVAAQAAQQKMNYNPPEDGKSGPSSAANAMEERKTGATGKTASSSGGQSIAFSSKPDLADASVPGVTGSGVIDSSARLLNLSSTPIQTSSSTQTSHYQQQQQQLQRNQPQQQYTIYLQKQQQYAAAAAAVAAARSKGPVTSNGSMFPDHSVTTSSVVGGKYPNSNSGLPQNLVQSTTGSPVHSPQWKTNSSRTTTPAQVQSPSILSSSAASSLKNVPQKQQGRPQQSQISFTANSSKPMPSGPLMQQGPSANQSQSPRMAVGSPSTSSVSKSAGGSPRTTTTSASTINKSGQVSSTLSSSQQSRNSPAGSVPNPSGSSAGGRNEPSSILGNPHVNHPTTSAGSKSQQPPKHALQQAQLFFSSPYMQSPQQQQQMTISNPSGYYLQRHQQPQGSSPAATSHSLCHPVSALSNSSTATATATSDPAKAIAAAAANNMKGGNLQQHGQGVPGSGPYASSAQPPGKLHHHQLVPPGFPYVHAVPAAVQVVKPSDQKQQAGE
ncbi:PREDICTED: protein TIME FOR COFFEE-like isoform X2 [Tarenaya hassleriana]|nr:PREDICTED: protein TIME FOR COFFEE-like isoform X2 [Tarenaya hassleriana]